MDYVGEELSRALPQVFERFKAPMNPMRERREMPVLHMLVAGEKRFIQMEEIAGSTFSGTC